MHFFYSSAVARLAWLRHDFSTGKHNPKTFFMKLLANTTTKLMLLVLSFLAPVVLLAQEGGTKIDVDINKNEGTWYTNPVIWIVGAAVFILLLVALLRGNNAPRR